MNVLEALQAWYAAQVDGDWEHQRGVTIETLDNPGWRITIDLEATHLERSDFQPVDEHRSDRDWIHAVSRDQKWECACGPSNLEEALRVFLAWSAAVEGQAAGGASRGTS